MSCPRVTAGWGLGIALSLATASAARVTNAYWAQAAVDEVDALRIGDVIVSLGQLPQVDDPAGLALDTGAGFLYWVQVRAFDDRLMRADVTGDYLQMILGWPDVDTPTAIAVDPSAGQLYWAQSFASQILRAGLDGARIELPVESPTS